MTRIVLLDALKDLTTEEIADILMPVAPQKDAPAPAPRAAETHRMRLPDSTAAKSKAPYIIIQVITGQDAQTEGNHVSSKATVRFIFVIYNDNEEEGALMLLNLMERLRIRLLKDIVVGGQFTLDLEEGLESIIYPDDTAPYYGGEMTSTWILPAVQREVTYG